MPREGALFDSVKSFFKTSHNGCQKRGDSFSSVLPQEAVAAKPDDNSTAPPLAKVADYPCRNPSVDASQHKGGTAPSLPGALPKALHRRLFSAFSLRPRSPLSTCETAICHSISDPFQDSSINNRAYPLGSSGRTDRSLRPQAKPSRLITPSRDGGSSVLSSTDMTSCATRDSSRRCMSLDIAAGALSSPAPPIPLRKQLRVIAPSLLSSSDAVRQVHSTELHSPSRSSLELPVLESFPPPPPPPLPANPAPISTLLALCPGVPAAMRRPRWCVEDYEVDRKLYKGATSTVYKAICRHSGLPVALKVYFLSRVPRNVIHMIVREVKIQVELVHRHIVMLYSAFQDEKRLVLVQEYAGRGDLYGIYRSLNRRLTEPQLTHLVLAPFLDALSYLHGRGICHRDIKPENILFTHDWRLLLADFGVSIDLNQERAVTRAGTLEYMAPEVERCPLKMLPEENKENMDLAYTTAVDIWATGVLAYEMLVGFSPFVGDRPPVPAAATAISAPVVGQQQAGSKPRKMVSFPSSVSSGARDFISLALAERAEERPTALQLGRHPWLAQAMHQAVL